MRKTMEDYQEPDRQWRALEQEHLQLHAEIAEDSKAAE